MADNDQDSKNSPDLPKGEQQADKGESNDIEKFRNIQSQADKTQAENDRLKKELEEAKKEKEDKSELEVMKQELLEIKKTKEFERIEKEYADIEPELLYGKTPEEQKEVVERQRARTKEFTAKSIDVNAPQYSENDINAQIDAVGKSSKSPIQQAMEIQKLERLKRESN